MTQPNNADILTENRVNSDAGLPLIQPYKEKFSNQHYVEQNYFSNPSSQQKIYNQYSSQSAHNSQNVSLEKERNINYNLIKLSDLNTNHYKGKGAQHYIKNSQQGNKKYGGIVNSHNVNSNFTGGSNTLAVGNNQNIIQKQQTGNSSRGYSKGMPSSSTQAVDEIIKNSTINQNSNTVGTTKLISQSNPNSNFQSRAELHKNDTSPLLSLDNATFSQKQIDTHMQSQGDILLSQIDLEPLGGNDNKKYHSQVGSSNNFDDQLTIFNKDKFFLNQNNINLKGSTLNIQFMNSSYNNADLLSINNDKLSLNNDILSICNDKLSLYETASQGNTIYLNNLNLLHQNDSSSFLTRSMCDNNTLPHMNLLSQVSENLDSTTIPNSIHYANYLQNNIIQRRKNSKQIVDELLGNSYNTTLDETKPQQIFSAFPQQRRNSFRKRNVYSVHQPHHNYQQIPAQLNQHQIMSDRRHNISHFDNTAQFQQPLKEQKDKQHMKLSEVVNRAGEVLNTKYLQEEIIIDVPDKKLDTASKQQKSTENNLQEKNFSFFQVAQQQQQNGKKQNSNKAIKDPLPPQNQQQGQNQQQQQQQPIKIKEQSKSVQQTPKNINDINLQVFSSGINSSLNSRRNISPPKVLPVIQIEKENDYSANRIELDFQKQRKQSIQPEVGVTKSKGRRFKSIDNQKSTTNQQQNSFSYQPSTFDLENANADKFQL